MRTRTIHHAAVTGVIKDPRGKNRRNPRASPIRRVATADEHSWFLAYRHPGTRCWCVADGITSLNWPSEILQGTHENGTREREGGGGVGRDKRDEGGMV